MSDQGITKNNASGLIIGSVKHITHRVSKTLQDEFNDPDNGYEAMTFAEEIKFLEHRPRELTEEFSSVTTNAEKNKLTPEIREKIADDAFEDFFCRQMKQEGVDEDFLALFSQDNTAKKRVTGLCPHNAGNYHSTPKAPTPLNS